MQKLRPKEGARARWAPTVAEANALSQEVPAAFKKHDRDGLLTEDDWRERLRLVAWCHTDPVRPCPALGVVKQHELHEGGSA